MTKGGKNDDDDAISPWLAGVRGVKGVLPPGRRLSPLTERRPNAWSASGVRGVVPPGRQAPGEGPADETRAQAERRQTLRDKDARRALADARRKRSKDAPPESGRKPKRAETVDPGRPGVGFRPDPFEDQQDPASLKEHLDALAEFFATHHPGADAMESVAELIVQSRAPFEIAVGFTVLSVLVGRDAQLRHRFMMQLERGAKTFYNLSMRLDPKMKPPRGLSPHTMDPIFYDLPSSALQVPYAFATDAFCRMLELLRGDARHDAALLEFARTLWTHHIERRALGDKPLKDLFPFSEPEWAPEPDDDETPSEG